MRDGGRRAGLAPPADFEWSLCRVFLAAARRGSIASAALELGVSHPTVRRRLDSLESSLGVTLFTRSQDGVRLTSEGRRLLGSAERVAAAAATMSRSAGWRADGGVVGVAADRLLGTELVPPMLAELRRTNPRLGFELMLGDDADEVLSRPADVALTTRRPMREGLVATRIATLSTGVFFAADPRRGADGSPSTSSPGSPQERSALDRLDPSPRLSGLFTRDGAAALAATLSGLGPAMLPVCIASKHPTLVRAESEEGELPVWIAFHPDLRAVPQVREVVDALRDGMARLAAAAT